MVGKKERTFFCSLRTDALWKSEHVHNQEIFFVSMIDKNKFDSVINVIKSNM